MKYGHVDNDPHWDPRHRWDCVEALVAAGRGDVTLVDEHGHTPLFRAIIDDVVPIASTVQALVGAGADINGVDENTGYTPLMFAINHAGQVSAEQYWVELTHAAEACLAAGADPNIVTARPHPWFNLTRVTSTLIVAADADAALCMKLLVASGARVDITLSDENDTVGSFALQIAATRGCSGCVRELLAAGVDTFRVQNSRLLTQWRRLHVHGPNSDVLVGSALRDAINCGVNHRLWSHVEVVVMLIRAGAPFSRHYMLPSAEFVDQLPENSTITLYLNDILAAGSHAAFERARRDVFVEMFKRGGRFPEDIIRVIVDFWVHDLIA